MKNNTEKFCDYLKTEAAKDHLNYAIAPLNREFGETFGCGGFEANSTLPTQRLLVCCTPGWNEPNMVNVQLQDVTTGEMLEDGYEADYPFIFTDDNAKNLRAYAMILYKACEDATRLN